MPVEDNGFLLLRTAEGQVAWLHATWTEWKNTFSFEVFGRDAQASRGRPRWQLRGREAELLQDETFHGSAQTTIWEYPGEDNSWRAELEAFAAAIEARRSPPVTLRDAHAALTVVHRVYAASRRAT